MATDGYGLQNDAAPRGSIQSANWNLGMDAIQVIGEVFGLLGGEGFINATDFNATAVGATKFVDVSNGYGIVLKDGVYVAVHQPDAQTSLAIVGTTASPQTNYGYIDPDGVCTVVQNPVNAPAASHLAWTCTCTDAGASAIDQLPDGRQNLLSILAARVSADDEQAGYLSTKVVAGTNVTATVLNNGLDETLSIAAPNLVSDLGDTMTGQLILSPSTDVEALILKAHASLTADIMEIFDSTGTLSLFRFSPESQIHLAPISSGSSRVVCDGFGTSLTVGIETRAARGTRGSETAIQLGDIIGKWNAGGHRGASTYLTNLATIFCKATENFGAANGGTYWDIHATPLASVTAVSACHIHPGYVESIGRFVSGVSSPAQITANQNDYALGDGRFQRLSTDASRNITGIVATLTGDERVICNVGAQPLVLTNEDVLSVAANRIITGTGASVTIAAGTSRIIWYDGTTARWRLI